ncbi:site-specific DNA-methyltransferase [Helicobacter pylori]|nr:site-specific DNA-methyltransferase [Helicobacter pylori]
MTDKNQAKKMGINIIQSQQENNPLFDMLLKNFPQTIKDGQVSLNAIKMLLGFNESMNDISGYELTWTGKGLANALYSEPCQKQLKLQESFTPQTSASKHPNNAIIIGDNLDALKLLKSAYSEKIKMIYIDPPYNTGNDDFIYTDNFRQDYQKILREVGLMEIDENGKETESESLKFFKNTQGSGTHSGWLSFMLPRLKLARDLLKEDGVIFISIDDNECANLKILCDEIFGEGNFLSSLTWLKGNAQNDAQYFQNNYENILVYAKHVEALSLNRMASKKEVKVFCENDKYYYEGAGLTTGGAGGTLNARANLGYSIYYNPKTLDFLGVDDYDKKLAKSSNDENLVYNDRQDLLKQGYKIIRPPKKGVGLGRWTWALDTFNSNKNIISIKKNSRNEYVICKKEFLDKKQVKQNENGEFYAILDKSSPTRNVIENIGGGNGTKEVNALFNQKIFNNPKPLKLINRLIELSTNEGDIILDFFAGSGTTAHAVMELNAEDKGNREFILVQIDEEIKEDKSTYDFCKNVLKSTKPVISDITIERVKRAAQKIIQSSKDSGLDLGFKVYTLQDKAQITNDKERITLFNHSILTPFDKALNLALQCGKTLDQALEIIIKDKLYKCEDAYFCIVCDKEVQEYLARSKNEMIFLDGYEEIDLQAFLNLNASFKERLSVVY